MQIQSYRPTPSVQIAQIPQGGGTSEPPAAAADGDKVDLGGEAPGNAPPAPPKGPGIGVIAKGALFGAAALGLPTLVGAALGPAGAIGLGIVGAGAGLAFGKVSGFLTFDFRGAAALALGGGGAALALAGNAFGMPGVGVAAAAGALAMGALLARR